MNKKAALRGLYGITDASLLNDESSLLHAVEQALLGGMRILQYRDKSLPYSQSLDHAQKLLTLCHNYQAVFIVNDDVELAAEVQADGVHVGGSDASVESARQRLGPDTVIGHSCYNRLDLAIEAQAQGADYVAFGRFFPSRTKPQAVLADGDVLMQASEELEIPVCAIGGITIDNASVLIEQGADMVAVIDNLFSSEQIEMQARRFNRLFQ